MKKDPQSLLEMATNNTSPDDTNMAASISALKSRLKSQPGEIDAVIADTRTRVIAQFDIAEQNMRVPVNQRTPLGTDVSNSPANAIARSMTAFLPKMIDKYAGDQARIRLLGVHALIRRYQWDHNSLPASLGDIDGEDLITDPFTGDHLKYTRDKDRYTLTSAGPVKFDGTQQRDLVKLR